MTHQPLDGNLALQSLSIYNDQWYTFLKKRKNTLLMVPATHWYPMLSGPCAYSVLSYFQVAVLRVFNILYVNLWCFELLLCQSLETCKWQCYISCAWMWLTIDKRMRSQISGKDIIMNAEEIVLHMHTWECQSAKTVLGDLCWALLQDVVTESRG